MRKSATIGEELDSATASLQRAGIPHWRLLPITTWATIAGMDVASVWKRREASPPDDRLLSRFRDAIGRQAAGEPFEYAVGRAAFRTLDLMVDRRVIIPRTASELLVDQVLAHAPRRSAGDEWGVAAEIGTGSGAVALALAVEGRFSRIIATDVSSDALAVAAANLAAVSPKTPVELKPGSWLDPLQGLAVDVIVSNPPCVPSADWNGLLPRVRSFEPRLAFDGGADGLDPARALIGGAAEYLAEGGLLVLEIAPGSGRGILRLAREAGWRDALVEEDAGGRGVYFRART